MRADRLISLILLLQTRGRLTAPILARLLEVSERTIYRDVQALCAAGIPVFTTPGPEGGIELVDSYRTSLTGLSEAEARAIFLLHVPDALARLGVGRDLQNALRKLSAALPSSRYLDEGRIRRRFYLPPAGDLPKDTRSHPGVIYQAVWQDRCLWICYQPGPVGLIERLVEPYALALDHGEWHLIYCRQGHFRVARVDDLLAVRLDESGFTRQDPFDPEAFWKTWQAESERTRNGYEVSIRLRADSLQSLLAVLGNRLQSGDEHVDTDAPDGRLVVRLAFDSFVDAHTRLLALGGAVEVLEPYALRCTLIDTAEQILLRYRENHQ